MRKHEMSETPLTMGTREQIRTCAKTESDRNGLVVDRETKHIFFGKLTFEASPKNTELQENRAATAWYGAVEWIFTDDIQGEARNA